MILNRILQNNTETVVYDHEIMIQTWYNFAVEELHIRYPRRIKAYRMVSKDLYERFVAQPADNHTDIDERRELTLMDDKFALLFCNRCI